MPEGEKKTSGPRITAQHIIYAVPGVFLVGFFAWVLSQMAAQQGGPLLVRMLVGVAIMLIGGGLIFKIMQRKDADED